MLLLGLISDIIEQKNYNKHPLAGDMQGKVFLGEKLDTTSMEISVQKKYYFN